MLGDSHQSLLLLIHFGDFSFCYVHGKILLCLFLFLFLCYHMPPVTDGERAECVDPEENGAILDAGGGGAPGPPGGGKSGQLASDSGGG